MGEAQDSELIDAKILALREAYREAFREIDLFPQPERAIGVASLKSEATQTYNRLVSAKSGLTDTAISPLKDYIGSLSGGEAAVKAVGWLDTQAKHAMVAAIGAVWASLAGTEVAAGVVLFLGILSVITNAAEQFGAAIFTSLAAAVASTATAGIVLYRFFQVAATVGDAASRAWVHGWAWAVNVGVRSDTALARSRKLELDLLKTTGRSTVPAPFTSVARARAQAIVGTALACAAAGLALAAYGFYNAAKLKLCGTGTGCP